MSRFESVFFFILSSLILFGVFYVFHLISPEIMGEDELLVVGIPFVFAVAFALFVVISGKEPQEAVDSILLSKPVLMLIRIWNFLVRATEAGNQLVRRARIALERSSLIRGAGSFFQDVENLKPSLYIKAFALSIALVVVGFVMLPVWQTNPLLLLGYALLVITRFVLWWFFLERLIGRIGRMMKKRFGRLIKFSSRKEL